MYFKCKASAAGAVPCLLTIFVHAQGRYTMGATKITVLCENRAGGLFGITGEHGFAALIEKDGEKLLMDTGQGMTLQGNATALGIDLTSINKISLSHGHYDHTGGLPFVLFPPRNVEIIAHPDIFDQKYVELDSPEGKQRHFIGIKFAREFLESGLGAKFSMKKEYEEISPGIFFSGEIVWWGKSLAVGLMN